MKALIEESTRGRKLPGPIGVGATGIAEVGVVATVRPAAILGSLGMFIAAIKKKIKKRKKEKKKKMICKVVKGLHQEMTRRKDKIC